MQAKNTEELQQLTQEMKDKKLEIDKEKRQLDKLKKDLQAEKDTLAEKEREVQEKVDYNNATGAKIDYDMQNYEILKKDLENRIKDLLAEKKGFENEKKQ